MNDDATNINSRSGKVVHKLVNGILFLTLLALVGFYLFIGCDSSRPNWEFFPNMAYSLAYESFSPNPAFADGKTLRQPAEGAIIHGEMPLHYKATREDAERAGRELKNPFSMDNEEAKARGEMLFNIYCLPCHGASGKGDGLVPKRGFPPPPSLLTGKSTRMADGRLFHIITYGQGSMASYAAQLTEEERWQVILHVRSLQGK